jgi:Fur family peroxide stress response transcriptional regulator
MKNQKRFEQIIHKVKKNGYNLTPQRYEIIRTIAESKDHPSIADVYLKVKSIYPMVSLNTIYKNISMLLEIHEIKEIKSFQNVVRYDGDISSHAHIICKKCKDIIDLPAPDNSYNASLETYIAPETIKEYNITDKSIEYYGICKKCADR